jgi:ketosteroid isomerase-like protein
LPDFLSAAIYSNGYCATQSARQQFGLRQNKHMPDLANIIHSTEIFRQFVTAINRHDANAIAMQITAGHLFVDSLGNRVTGAASIEAGWRGYFAMCPDYWIRADHVMAEGVTLLAAGEAGGTINGEPWRTPAAWNAIIREGKVAEWRVFADNKPVYEILARRQAKSVT